jgi:hypothetical protein
MPADGDALGRFRRAVPVKASELVAAPLAAPPLLARDDAVPDQAATTAPGTVWKIGDHQDPKLQISPDYLKSDISGASGK